MAPRWLLAMAALQAMIPGAYDAALRANSLYCAWSGREEKSSLLGGPTPILLRLDETSFMCRGRIWKFACEHCKWQL